MVAGTIVLFLRRSLLSFALAFYLIHLFLISNLFFDIGATMGERLVYHSSFGFVLVVGWLIWQGIKRFDPERRVFVAGALSVILVIGSAFITIPRNAQWKNDTTLFIADAATVPNSALVNGNAGKGYIDLSEQPENKGQEKELLQKAIYHLTRSVQVHDKYVNGYLNLGVAYFKLKDYEKAEKYWRIAGSIYPNNPFLKTNMRLLGSVYFDEAMTIGAKDPAKAIAILERAVDIDPSNPELWYNLGGASYTIKDFTKARMAWTKTLQLKPDHQQAQQGMAALPPVE